MAQSYHLHICFNNILGIYLNDKLNSYYDMLVKNIKINEKNRYHKKAISKLTQHSLIKTFIAKVPSS